MALQTCVWVWQKMDRQGGKAPIDEKMDNRRGEVPTDGKMDC